MRSAEAVGDFMTQIGQPITTPFVALVESDPKCEAKPDTTKWSAKINDWGTTKGCSGTALYASMLKDKAKDQGYLGPPTPFVAKPEPHTSWSLADVGPEKFPVQAHHIIPKNHLPEHPVCTFLAKNYTKSELYELTADAPYNTDHANNGYCLPYATPLAEWKKLDKSDDSYPWKLNLCFDVMKKTGRQLHQGSHRVEAYTGPIADDEEAGIHVAGYLEAVNELLDIVQAGSQKHAAMCDICNPGLKNDPKIKITPRQAVVAHVDQVSGIVKLLVDSNRTFISEPASMFGETLWGKFTTVNLPAWMGGS